MHVEICIPVYNEEEKLGNLLGALTRQTHKNFSVRIFDNASTDGTVSIIHQYREALDMELVRRSVNIGQNSNINRVFANCSSDFIALLSGNDLVEENYLEALLGILIDNPDAASAYARAVAIDENGRPLAEQPENFQFFSLDDDDPIKRCCESVRRYCQASNFFAMYRKTVLDRVQPQPYRYGGDHVLAAEVALYGKVLFSDRTVVYRSPWPVSGRSQTRTEHLLRLFSKDVERGLAEFSKLSNFELITPGIDMYHGFLNMFRHADIPSEQRPKLVAYGLTTITERMADAMQEDVENLARVFEFVAKGLRPGQFIDRVSMFHMLRKIDECLLVADHVALRELRGRLSAMFLTGKSGAKSERRALSAS